MFGGKKSSVDFFLRACGSFLPYSGEFVAHFALFFRRWLWRWLWLHRVSGRFPLAHGKNSLLVLKQVLTRGFHCGACIGIEF